MSALFPSRPRFEAKLPDEIKDGVQVYVFAEDFIFNSPTRGQLVIQKGYETNFASIPAAAKPYVDDDSPHILCPSCVHDKRYDEQAITREEADDELRCNCIACGMRPSQARVVWLMVRMFGGSHWKTKSP